MTSGQRLSNALLFRWSIAPSHASPEAGQGMAPLNPPGLRPDPTASLRVLRRFAALSKILSRVEGSEALRAEGSRSPRRGLSDESNGCVKLLFSCLSTQSQHFFVPSSCLGVLRGEKLRRPHTRATHEVHPVRRLFENAKKLTKTPNHPPQKNENRRKFLIRPAQKRSFTRKRSQARTSAQKSRTGALRRA